MNRQTYRKMTETVKRSTVLSGVVVKGNGILTKLSYAGYPLFLAFLLIGKEPGVLRAVLVPGISFVLVSIFRRYYCAPRPYEVFQMSSVIEKETPGKSFPSRHVFSVFVIAATMFHFYPAAGVLFGVAGVFLAVFRVLGGVHFPKDVIAGATMGIGCGLAGFC